MSNATSPIATHDLRIASPCPVAWESMTGNERVRRCAVCDLNVYNVSAMTPPEARHLMKTHEGRLCVMYYSRPDGTIITRDCPVGVAAIRRRVGRICRRAIGAFALTIGLVLWLAGGAKGHYLRKTPPFSRLCNWLDPSPSPRITPPLLQDLRDLGYIR